jgi:hypothetical protein
MSFRLKQYSYDELDDVYSQPDEENEMDQYIDISSIFEREEHTSTKESNYIEVKTEIEEEEEDTPIEKPQTLFQMFFRWCNCTKLRTEKLKNI